MSYYILLYVSDQHQQQNIAPFVFPFSCKPFGLFVYFFRLNCAPLPFGYLFTANKEFSQITSLFFWVLAFSRSLTASKSFAFFISPLKLLSHYFGVSSKPITIGKYVVFIVTFHPCQLESVFSFWRCKVTGYFFAKQAFFYICFAF